MLKTKSNDAAIVLIALEKESKPIIRKVSDLRITTMQDYENAAQMVSLLKEKAKQADEREKEFTKPLNKLLRDTRSLFEPFKDRIAQIEQDTKARMLEFVEYQEVQRKKLEEKFEDGKIKKVSTLVAKQAALDINSSSSQVRKTWQLVMVDEKKTPREYLIPNEQLIKEALKEGRKVAGWKLEQVKSIAI